ncbi:MAG TPA: hypothetical protein VGF40_12610, partial [Thermoanaerobaculia bacterium]
MDGFARAVADQGEEKAFFEPPVVDLSRADLPPLRVGEEQVLASALRKEVPPHGDREDVSERAPAEAHRVADPDRRAFGAGGRQVGGVRQHRDDGVGADRRGEAVGAAQRGGDRRDGGQRLEVFFGVDPEPRQRRVDPVGPGGGPLRVRGAGGQPLERRDEIGVDRDARRPPRVRLEPGKERADLRGAPGGDLRAARRVVEIRGPRSDRQLAALERSGRELDHEIARES